MKKFSLFALSLALFAPTISHADDTVTNLTIYGNSPQSWSMPSYYRNSSDMPGYAIISFMHSANLTAGINNVTISNIPDEADPSSVMVKSSRNIQVVEQNFNSGQLNTESLLKRNIGKEVEVEKYGNNSVVSTKGTLLDASGALVVKDDNKIKVIKDYSSVTIAGDNTIASGNNLSWLLNTDVAGNTMFEYSYKTSGISWVANYNIYLDGKTTEMMARIEGWANLVNGTSLDIKETPIKLVAGETAQAPSSARAMPMMAMAKASGVAMDSAESAPAMQQQKFSDYHMYTIDRKVSLPAGSTKKIKLFTDKAGVLATRKYIFDGGTSGDNSVKSVITFTNDQKSNLGIPLPGGKYRVFAKDASGAFELAGETAQEHHGEGEKVELTIGNSFDLKATRNQVDNEQDQLRHRGKYTVTVEIESALDEEVEVTVKEPVYQQNWEIAPSTHDFKKINTNLAEFKVPVKPKGKTKLEYSVQYSW